MLSHIDVCEGATITTHRVKLGDECRMQLSCGKSLVFKREGKNMVLTATMRASINDRAQVSTALSNEIEARADDVRCLENKNIDHVLDMGRGGDADENMEAININVGVINNHIKRLSEAHATGFEVTATTILEMTTKVDVLSEGKVWDIGGAYVQWVEQDWDSAVNPVESNSYTIATQHKETFKIHIPPHTVSYIARLTGNT
jgi:hypothetical protein